jgi:hypothetical protein
MGYHQVFSYTLFTNELHRYIHIPLLDIPTQQDANNKEMGTSYLALFMGLLSFLKTRKVAMTSCFLIVCLCGYSSA